MSYQKLVAQAAFVVFGLARNSILDLKKNRIIDSQKRVFHHLTATRLAM